MPHEPVFITAARRTPVGRLGGALASLSAADLAVQLAAEVVVEDLRGSVDGVVLGHDEVLWDTQRRRAP